VPRYDSPVAVTARSTLDAQKLRADFPIFEQKIHGKPLAYLDSAASSQKPRQVLDVMREFYETSYANVHRGVYTLSERATEGYEGAREKARAFVNALSAREVIFTRSATESINLVAYAWGLDNLGPGDLVLVTELEHHSNFVPWQYIAKRTGADFRMLPIDDGGELRLDGLDELAGGARVKVVATNLVSNSLGTINPVERLGAWAHAQGAIMVVDAAQGAPHHRVDVQALDCDFLAFSSHKLCGPTGVGALWGRAELLEKMAPFNLGGHMIRSVRLEETTWGDLPYKFEAGTQPIAEAVGFGAAMDYVNEVGLEAIEQYESELVAYTLDRFAELGGITSYGPPPERRAGIVSFNVEGIHPHDVAQVLDSEGVAIRAGHHCCQPLMTRLGVAATNRASYYLYSLPDEIDRLIEGLHKVRKILG
jgi:cysteine desulfurase/selenocysteine lyase